jgi:hypothetical protein
MISAVNRIRSTNGGELMMMLMMMQVAPVQFQHQLRLSRNGTFRPHIKPRLNQNFGNLKKAAYLFGQLTRLPFFLKRRGFTTQTLSSQSLP